MPKPNYYRNNDFIYLPQFPQNYEAVFSVF